MPENVHQRIQRSLTSEEVSEKAIMIYNLTHPLSVATWRFNEPAEYCAIFPDAMVKEMEARD